MIHLTRTEYFHLTVIRSFFYSINRIPTGYELSKILGVHQTTANRYKCRLNDIGLLKETNKKNSSKFKFTLSELNENLTVKIMGE
jgi:Fic family protein